MRVLVLAPSFHPVIGGAETYAYQLARGLTGRGHQVCVVTDLPHGMPVEQAGEHQPPGVRVVRLHSYRGTMFDASLLPWEQMTFGLAPGIVEVVDEFRPDLVLSNSIDTAYSAVAVSLQYDLPWAAAFHEQSPELDPLGTGRLALVYGRMRPDLVLAGSEFYAGRARRWGDPGRVSVIHHGVELPDPLDPGARAAIRARYGAGPGDVLVVCAGRLKRRKGMVELVRAVARAGEHGVTLRLVIAGTVNSASQDYADLLDAEIDRLGLRSRATIDQTVRITEVTTLLAAADIVAQPSFEEGLGLAVLEAMAVATPVLTTDIEGTREIVFDPEVAVVVKPGDVAAIAEQLAALARDPGRRDRLGARGRAHVAEHFSMAHMIDRTEAALSALSTRRPAGARR